MKHGTQKMYGKPEYGEIIQNGFDFSQGENMGKFILVHRSSYM